MWTHLIGAIIVIFIGVYVSISIQTGEPINKVILNDLERLHMATSSKIINLEYLIIKLIEKLLYKIT